MLPENLQLAIDAMIVQSQKNAKSMNQLLETMIVQNGKESTERLLDIVIQQNENVLKEYKGLRKEMGEKSNEGVIKAVQDLAPKFEGISSAMSNMAKAMVEMANNRTGRFLGEYETMDDLPEDAIKGDFAIVKQTGDLVYV